MDITLQRIIEELKSQRKRQTDLTDYLGVTDSSFGNWKKGLNQSYKKYLHGIAQFLGVSVEYLKGETDIKKAPAENGEGLNLTAHEIELINAYRAKPEMQASIDKLLDIDSNTTVSTDMAETFLNAANHPIGQK